GEHLADGADNGTVRPKPAGERAATVRDLADQAVDLVTARPEAEPTHDAHWTVRRWVAEGRRPSLDELVPETEAEAARWQGAIRAEFAGLIENRTFAGLRVEFDRWRDPISTYRDEVVLRLRILDENGQSAGRAVRVFRREYDGTLTVRHSSLRLDEGVQGNGFASRWNAYRTGWDRESGVSHIE